MQHVVGVAVEEADEAVHGGDEVGNAYAAPRKCERGRRALHAARPSHVARCTPRRALPATVDEAAVAMICADVMVQMQNSFDWRAANRSAEAIPRTYLQGHARQEGCNARVQRGANAAHRNQ
jgi:hypothetical protein